MSGDARESKETRRVSGGVSVCVECHSCRMSGRIRRSSRYRPAKAFALVFLAGKAVYQITSIHRMARPVFLYGCPVCLEVSGRGVAGFLQGATRTSPISFKERTQGFLYRDSRSVQNGRRECIHPKDWLDEVPAQRRRSIP